MLILMDRIGRAVIGVLAVAGIVIAIDSQRIFIAFVLALIVLELIIFTVIRERSRTVTRARDRLQRLDPEATVFVSGRPSRTSEILDRYSLSGSPVLLPSIFPVVMDASGLSYFSINNVPAALAFIPWSKIGEIEFNDRWSESKASVLAVGVDGSALIFHVRSLIKGEWASSSTSQPQLVHELEAARPVNG